MNKKTSLVKILKNEDSEKVLKEVYNDFSIFSKDVIEIKKKHNRPNDYYIEGDTITFTITLKNVGDKRIVDFTLKDELEDLVLPIDDGYVISTSVGQIQSCNRPIIINNITLKPQEVAVITISGIIGVTE
jgi:uncharacterized repeat protein (TIGR01451 family)